MQVTKIKVFINIWDYLLSNYYKIADIFVFPSRQEGLPNVVLEAAASRLPVVVTRLPGIEDIIQENQVVLILDMLMA
jgi:glycosyltransferase involved in cell wall biosynthesis